MTRNPQPHVGIGIALYHPVTGPRQQRCGQNRPQPFVAVPEFILGQHIVQYVTGNVGESKVAALEPKRLFLVIDP